MGHKVVKANRTPFTSAMFSRRGGAIFSFIAYEHQHLHAIVSALDIF
jgi:hypothetical protein